MAHLEDVLVEPEHQKKRISSPLIPPRINCIKRAGEPTLHLGVASATTSKLLHATLCSSLIPSAFEGLVDSGSSDCFLDSDFVTTNKLPFQKIALLPIALIDGTVNAYVNSTVMLPIEFPCGYSCTPEFYVTKLERTYLAVLGYSWLSQCNPTIDWTEGTMLCQKPAFTQLPLLFLPVQDNITPDHTESLSLLIKETTLPIKPPLQN